jgi:hypothetical protein
VRGLKGRWDYDEKIVVERGRREEREEFEEKVRELDVGREIEEVGGFEEEMGKVNIEGLVEKLGRVGVDEEANRDYESHIPDYF